MSPRLSALVSRLRTRFVSGHARPRRRGRVEVACSCACTGNCPSNSPDATQTAPGVLSGQGHHPGLVLGHRPVGTRAPGTKHAGLV
jgi:hypothetical protein